MPDPAGAGDAAHPRDDVVRGEAGRFVDHDQPAGSGAPPGPRARPAATGAAFLLVIVLLFPARLAVRVGVARVVRSRGGLADLLIGSLRPGEQLVDGLGVLR